MYLCYDDVSHSQSSAEEAEEGQTKFSVKLVSFSGDTKVKLIKEVKMLMEGMNLVQVWQYGMISLLLTASACMFLVCLKIFVC